MSIPSSLTPLFNSGSSAAGGYQVSRSLRFNSSDSAYLSQNTSRSPAANTSITFSFWAKLSSLTTDQTFFSSSTGGFLQFTYWGATYGNKIYVYHDSSGLDANTAKSDGVLRDPSAWYHFLYSRAHNSNGTLYINGVAQATQSTNTANIDFFADASRRIGAVNSGARYVSSCVADFHCIDGQQLTPSSFTEVSATTGQLIPKAYTGTFGTNGFWLKFSDNSAATAATLGKDYSGNSNNWTPNNLSVTAGAGNDSLVDTPTSNGTDTGVGNEVRGNYATLNPLDLTSGNGASITNGNLDAILANASIRGTIAIPSSGKWYYELTISQLYISSYGGSIGIVKLGTTSWSGAFMIVPGWDDANAGIYKNASKIALATGVSIGDVFGVAVNMDSLTLQIYRNNSVFGSAVSLDSATYTPYLAGNGTSTGAATGGYINFGQRAFAYTAPSGFKALCDTNLGAPLVAKPNTLMDVKLYTGNGSTQTISGLGFSPDLVWIKDRVDGTRYHVLVDSVRSNGGSGSLLELYSNATDAETQFANRVTSLTSDGFTLGADATTGVNKLNDAHVAWAWDAGTSTVSNTQGSITSQVRANVSAGFSVVTWTGGGSGYSVGHGLGVAPKLYIIKDRNNAFNWPVFTTVIDGSLDFLYLNLTNAKTDSGGSLPTSTLVYPGQSTSSNYVMYCFAPVVGYSSFGNYTGNGSADGPFVYTGFRPRFILTKATNSALDWNIFDAARDPYNSVNKVLFPNLSNAESDYIAYTPFDFLSNGFKLRTSIVWNASSTTYIYAAFAENPFQYARAR